jgi:hypothetical protein
VFGLTWDNIRSKLVKAIGEPAVKALEIAFDIVVTLVKEGPAAAWEKIKEQLSDLKEMVMGMILDMVKSTIVEISITKILSFLSPVGAFIQAIIAIYNTIMFFIERLKTIGQVVASFIDSISAIAAGNIGSAAARVETTMAGLLTLVISFLARFIGLGKVSDKVKEIIQKIRAPIDKALDKVIDWIVALARKLGKLVAGAVGIGPSAGPDQRTPAQKQADAQSAVDEATKVLRKPEVTPEEVRAALPPIKTRFRLTSLELVTVSSTEAQDVDHVVAVVNPRVLSTDVKLMKSGRPVALKGKTTPNLDLLATYPAEKARGVMSVYVAGWMNLKDKDEYTDIVDYVEQRAARKLGKISEGKAIADFVAKSGISVAQNRALIEILDDKLATTGRDRIPDFWADGVAVGDVKRVAELSYDSQLRDAVVIARGGHARIKGTTALLGACAQGFHVIVRGPSDELPNGTHVTGPLRSALRTFPGKHLWRLLP